MTAQEYRDALLRVAQIGKQLLAYMDEDAQDLFEAYGDLHERIVKHELLHG